MNAPVLLFTIPVDGREKKFKARALSMTESGAWCPLAKSFNAAFSEALESEADTVDVLEQGIDALKQYPRIEQADRIDWDEVTAEQLVYAINTLLEMNDPFTRARIRRAEQNEKNMEAVSMMHKMGLNAGQLTELQKRLESRTQK